MQHIGSNLLKGYNELLSFCACTHKMINKNLISQTEANELLSDLGEQMIPYESLLSLFKIEIPPPQKEVTEPELRVFVETYSPQIIKEEGLYEILVESIFN